jgi:hypothetical protein
MNDSKVLGVDIGNVIIDNRLNTQSKLDEAGYSKLPVVGGAFENLKILTDYFHGEVYLISKCTEWAQEQILTWLTNHDFYSITGINPEHIYFVRERHEKDAVCQKLDVTHFIDDRLEVLSHMIESTPNLILFKPDQKEVQDFNEFLPKVKVVNDWVEVVDLVVRND